MFKNLIFHHQHYFLRSLSRICICIWNPHLDCGFRMRIQETRIMQMRIRNTDLNGWIKWVYRLDLLSNILLKLAPWGRGVLNLGLALLPLGLRALGSFWSWVPWPPAQGDAYHTESGLPVSLPGSQVGLGPAAKPGLEITDFLLLCGLEYLHCGLPCGDVLFHEFLHLNNVIE